MARYHYEKNPTFHQRHTSSLCDPVYWWLNSTKLSWVSESKTEFFVAASPYYEKCLPETLMIGNSPIKPSQMIRNLGAYFDSNMTMASHITNVSRSITFHLQNISRIDRYFGEDMCHYALPYLILSRIDYCNGLLSSLPKSYTLRLQHLQNWAARLVFTINRQQDPKSLLKSLHWLHMNQKISFKLLLYVFKSLNDMAPVYLSNCFKLHVPKRNLGLQKIAYGLIIQGHVFKLVIKVLLSVPQSYGITFLFTIGNQFL